MEDNSVLVFSDLMDSASPFLTANCDALYFITFIDLTGGPMVLDIPALGARRGSWAPSMTCGSAGSPISACRVPTESRFWSVMLYDRQTRSMLQTGQSKPDSPASPARSRPARTARQNIRIGPTAPDGKAGNWIQTVPGKGFFTILRLYNPLQPFFDKTWQPSEMEPT